MAIGNALDSVGRDVLFIKDNKVVGKGRSQVGVSNEYQGCSFLSGELFEQIKVVAPFNDTVLTMKHVYARFSPYSGGYLGLQFTDEFPEAEALLEYVRAVDEHYFNFGIVPDSFKEVEGYGAERDAWKKDIQWVHIQEAAVPARLSGTDTQVISGPVEPSTITTERVMGWLKEFNMVEDIAKLRLTYQFKNKDQMTLEYISGDYFKVDQVNTLRLTYGEYCQAGPDENFGEGGGGYEAFEHQHFWPGFLEQAVDAFVGRITSDDPFQFFESKFSEKLDIIKIRQNKELVFESYYEYLDAMLAPFWKFVFDKTPDQMSCAGIVGAHGDKAYGYKEDWKDKGIPFARGVLLYLLTYTPAFKGEKSKSREWVIENYPHYLEQIELAEQQVLKERFNIEPKST